MILKGADGTSFELKLRGWGPNNPDPNHHREYDWLDVVFGAKTSSGGWGDEGELLTAEDVAALAGWLEDVAEHEPHEPVMWFIEPEFRFKVVREANDLVTLRVYLEYKGRPSWAPETNGDDFWIDLVLDRGDIRGAVASLRSVLSAMRAR